MNRVAAIGAHESRKGNTFIEQAVAERLLRPFHSPQLLPPHVIVHYSDAKIK